MAQTRQPDPFAVVQCSASDAVEQHNIAFCVEQNAPYIRCEWHTAFECLGILGTIYSLVIHIAPDARLVHVAKDAASRLDEHSMYVNNRDILVRNTRVLYAVENYCFLPDGVVRTAPSARPPPPLPAPSAYHQRDVEVVVARYAEDVSWLRPLATDASSGMLRLYNKGAPMTIESGFETTAIPLPNVGREAHTYLHHIVHHFDDMREYVVFVQGSILANEGCCTNPLQYVLDLVVSARALGVSANWKRWNDMYPTEYTMRERVACTPSEDGCFGDWFRKHVSPVYISDPKWFKGAVFCVRSEWIRTRPKTYYQTLLAASSRSVAPEEAYYLERAWYYVVRKVRVYDCVVYKHDTPKPLVDRIRKLVNAVDEFVVFESVLDADDRRKPASVIADTLKEHGVLRPFVHKIRHHVVDIPPGRMLTDPSAMLRAGLADPDRELELDDLVLLSDATCDVSDRWVRATALAYRSDPNACSFPPVTIPDKRLVVASVHSMRCV